MLKFTTSKENYSNDASLKNRMKHYVYDLFLISEIKTNASHPCERNINGRIGKCCSTSITISRPSSSTTIYQSILSNH